jgi:N-acetyl-D-muramate 6-phosphate phosphatase
MDELPRVILFDLDGTLLDTAPELANSLNQLRKDRDLSALPYDIIRNQVSKGSQKIIELGFPHITAESEIESLRRKFIDLYKENIGNETTLFPGIKEVLEAIESTGRIWGIVTNKIASLTDPLLTKVNLSQKAACVISGDTTPYYKPHPEPLYEAMRILQVGASECVYIGDDERDVIAAISAKIKPIVALYGYIDPNDKPALWRKHGSIDSPFDLLAGLKH